MPSSEQKKALRRAYKEQPVTGGVYAIRCLPTGRVFLYAAPNPQGQQNRFHFSRSTGTCIHAALAPDWRKYGADAFTFTQLETLEMRPDQATQAFHKDLAALADIWREKLAGDGEALY